MGLAIKTHPLATAPQLAQLLKAARKRRKLTQATVASRIGLSQNRLSYLELHPDEISVKQLLAWCATVGLELRMGDRDLGVAAAPEADW
ncbi:helix-turn-helix domain-containing protein [Piscinibacter sp.]|uniref:helix-turn-helix domain-containing protein n=1 Tax=Piscinibacter sp. TaxID=1903157 RepID=UPI002B5E5CE3|nr:helix-turn-helix domain-containing protein [Albitalea sp.]HUG25339.1 helix-turn-helix domain-containing protein [Albitalea sp.]